MVIQHNIPALNAHRNMGINNSGINKNLEKLSSGFRINRAADDAAGLAISEKMRGQIKGLAMAEQNTSHGINLIQTAEGGLNETHSILQRMRELAVQASNGTYQEDDLQQLTLEFEALKSEIDRIAESTHYNGIKLLNGNLDETLFAQRMQDSEDILKNATFGINAAAGDEFLLQVNAGAVTVVEEIIETKIGPTSATAAFDFQDFFDETKFNAGTDNLQLTFNVGGTATKFYIELQADENGGVDYEHLTAEIAKIINDNTDDLGVTAEVDSKNPTQLVITDTVTGETTKDLSSLFGAGGTQTISLAVTDSSGTPITVANGVGITGLNGAGGTTGTLAFKSFEDGTTNGWVTGTAVIDLAGLTASAWATTGSVVFEVAGKEFQFSPAAAANTLTAQAKEIIDFLQSDADAIAYLEEIGLKVEDYNTGDTAITFTATEMGDEINEVLADMTESLGLKYGAAAGSETAVAGNPTNAMTITDGVKGLVETKGTGKKEYVIDQSLIDIAMTRNNVTTDFNFADAKVYTTEDIGTRVDNGDPYIYLNTKTNVLQLIDEDGNVFSMDLKRLRDETVDYEAQVRAAQGDNLVFQIGANGGSDQRVYLAVTDMSSYNLGLYANDIKSNGIEATKDEELLLAFANITTIEDANIAIDVITAATNQVSSQRAELGALQNRLESAMNSLGVTKENLTAAESTIRDVDMAAEMMEFTKNSILVQASQAMLAQANQLPQGVLQLLR